MISDNLKYVIFKKEKKKHSFALSNDNSYNIFYSTLVVSYTIDRKATATIMMSEHHCSLCSY